MQSQSQKISVISHHLFNKFSGDEKTLAKWAYFKSKFPNSVIHSSRPSLIYKEGRTGLSQNTIHAYLKLFDERGLSHIDYKGRVVLEAKADLNEICRPKTKLDKRGNRVARKKPKKIMYLHLERGSIREIKHQLYVRHIIDPYQRLNHCLYKVHANTERAREGKYEKDKANGKPVATNFLHRKYRAAPVQLSSATLAKSWEVSKSTANRRAKSLDYKHVIKYNFQKRLLYPHAPFELFNELKNQIEGAFYYNGGIWQKMASVYMPFSVYDPYAMTSYMKQKYNSSNKLYGTGGKGTQGTHREHDCNNSPQFAS